jgi:hypothetical protein
MKFELSFYSAAYMRQRDRRPYDEHWRKGYEAYLLWKYRQETKISTFANYGRATLQEGDQLGSPELGTGYPSQVRPSRPPLSEPENDPDAKIWMDLRWAYLNEYEDIVRGNLRERMERELRQFGEGVPLLYKAVDPRTRKLLKVGFTSRGSAGLRDALAQVPGRPRMALSPLDQHMPPGSHVLLELRTDLIGGYVHQMGKPPVHQFNPSPEKPIHLRNRQLTLF